jgi:hypothetical protein
MEVLVAERYKLRAIAKATEAVITIITKPIGHGDTVNKELF